MERLNDILGRTPSHRQQNREQHNNASSQSKGGSPSRYPLREQTANLGPASRSAQSHYQHTIPSRTRSEQGQSTPQKPRPAYSRQQSGTHVPGRVRSWGAQGIAPADSVDAYSTLVGADVREEWEDDTANMRYGDWENEGNAEYLPFSPQEPGVVANGRHQMKQAPDENSQTYPRSSRSFVTRELHMTPDGESRPQMTHNPGDFYIQSRQLPPPQPLSQDVQRTIRMTQPLKPQSAPRAHQDVSQGSPYKEIPTPQIAWREQSLLYTPANPCPICKGAGYLRADVPYGHPNFGKPIACECKEAERKEKRRQQLQEMSNLGTFYDKSFENFNLRVPGIQEAFRAAYEFAQNPFGWLLLIGPNGCGKTHLAAAIANQSLEQGALVLFSTVPDLLDHLRAAFAPTSTEIYDQLFARMREAEVLVLDDLGAQQSSPWANEKLFQLLNYRYNSRFPTVITANSRGLQGIDERIRSRLTDASLVTTVILDRAKDYRPNNPRRV